MTANFNLGKESDQMANHDQINEVYYGRAMGTASQRANRERIHWICEQAAGKKILDIGCSQGIVSILLGRTGFEVTGIDVESVAIEYAVKELQKEEDEVSEKVKLIHANALTYDFGAEQYNTVIATEIIEHLTQPHLLYEKIFEILIPNGKVIITTPFGIMDYQDHKRTYCLSSLLNEIHPYFLPQQVHFIGNWICLTAERRKKITQRSLSVLNYSQVEQAENKFIEIERHWMDISKTCSEKNRQLMAKIELLKKSKTD